MTNNTERDALTRAREALATMKRIGEDGWCLCVSSSAQADVEAALRDLIAEAENGYEKREPVDLSDPAVVYDLVNEHVALPGVVEHARRQAEWCCEIGCGSGACESCPCCAAGNCVSGADFRFGELDAGSAYDVGRWLEIAAEHNPIAARLAAVLAEREPVIVNDVRPYSEHTDIEYGAWETDDIEEHAQDMLAVVRHRRAAAFTPDGQETT